MKNTIFLLLLFIASLPVRSQSFRNFGNTLLHHEAHIGFFDSVTNDAVFENRNGLVGFYGPSQKTCSGLVSPVFHDMEIASDKGLQLTIPIRVSNNLNFIYGDLITNSSNDSVFLEILETGFYTGSSHFSKTIGRLKIVISTNFIAPVGDNDSLRPISIQPLFPDSQYTTAYVFNQMQSVNTFDPNTSILVMDTEYWILEGENPTRITLSWDERSGLSSKVDAMHTLIIAGYHKATEQWQYLGNNNIVGTLSSGFLSSNEMIPKNYEMITLGILEEAAIAPTKPEIENQYNYYLSANGDGINDYLHIEGLEHYPDNEVKIYNRYGRLVFQKENYTNDFDGSMGINVPALNRSAGLPSGVYFYLATVNNGPFTMQGFLYLNQGE